MAITEANQSLGFWVFVRDEESAVYAARLCGLPLFLTGLWALLLALLAMIGEQAVIAGPAADDRFFGFLLVGGVLVVTGLLIRARFFGLVPVMATLFLVLCAGAILAAGGLIAVCGRRHRGWASCRPSSPFCRARCFPCCFP